MSSSNLLLWIPLDEFFLQITLKWLILFPGLTDPSLHPFIRLAAVTGYVNTTARCRSLISSKQWSTEPGEEEDSSFLNLYSGSGAERGIDPRWCFLWLWFQLRAEWDTVLFLVRFVDKTRQRCWSLRLFLQHKLYKIFKKRKKENKWKR